MEAIVVVELEPGPPNRLVRPPIVASMDLNTGSPFSAYSRWMASAAAIICSAALRVAVKGAPSGKLMSAVICSDSIAGKKTNRTMPEEASDITRTRMAMPAAATSQRIRAAKRAQRLTVPSAKAVRSRATRS
ncbi:MAG: hypothetical protein JKP95_00855 [Oceanicaulis sp.]|nr:hypothetical protein [Oceanicaulis sp.]